MIMTINFCISDTELYSDNMIANFPRQGQHRLISPAVFKYHSKAAFRMYLVESAALQPDARAREPTVKHHETQAGVRFSGDRTRQIHNQT